MRVIVFLAVSHKKMAKTSSRLQNQRAWQIQMLGQTYIDYSGDLNQIAEALGVVFREDATVRDPKDFALQFLDKGLVTGPRKAEPWFHDKQPVSSIVKPVEPPVWFTAAMEDALKPLIDQVDGIEKKVNTLDTKVDRLERDVALLKKDVDVLLAKHRQVPW